MWSVVGNALAARRGQAVIVAVIAVLAGAATAAAPWYAMSATSQVAVDAMAGAPTGLRLVTVTRLVPAEQLTEDPAQELRQVLDPPSFTTVFGTVASVRLTGWTSGDAEADTGSAGMTLAYREDVCAHLWLTGDCPAADDQVVVSAALAERRRIAVGDQVELTHGNSRAVSFQVVGTYQVRDSGDPFWGDGELIGQRTSATPRETLFVPLAGLSEIDRMTYTYELVADPDVLTTLDIDELRALVARGAAELRARDYAVTSGGIDVIAGRIAADQRNVGLGVGVGVAVLLLLAWFTLVVVVRVTLTQLRGDVGWWRLHGIPAGRGWLVALGQSAVPLVGGAVLGGATGLGLGRILTGPAPDPAAGQLTWRLTLALVAVTVAGGLVAVVVTQLGTLRTPVRDLLRRVPARGRRWRRSVVDLLLIVIAAAAVGQALLIGQPAGGQSTGGQSTGGLALLAPPLAVLAIALVAAWAVPPLAAALAARGLHAGRLAVALVAASLARRAGMHRLFALIAVAVGLLTAGLVGWDTEARAQAQRAALETGAHRVVTVQAIDAAGLLAAVRAVDPEGTQAMAVVHQARTPSHPAVLALDTTRLGVITGWRPEYGGTPAQVAAALRPAEPEPLVVTGDPLVIEAAATGAETETYLRVLLRTLDTGVVVAARVGPLAGEPDTYPAEVAGCAGAGCRLVGLALLGPGNDPPTPGTRIDLHGLTGAGGAPLADPARWRTALGPRDLGPVIGALPGGGLSLTVPAEPEPGAPATVDHWVFVVDTPLPLPVLAAGWSPEPTELARLSPLPRVTVPVAVAATGSLAPRYPHAALVDLEYAERLVPFQAASSGAQVWLSERAPPSIVDDLREVGVTPMRVQSLDAGLDRLRSGGSAVGVRFRAMVGLVGLLLAAGAVLVFAAQERAGRAAELSALRAQGIGRTVARRAGYGGLAAVGAGAVLIGLVAGMAGAMLAQLLHPGFVDEWRLLPVPPYRPYPIGGATLAAVVVLGGAALAAAATGLVRTTRSITRATPGGPA